MGKPLELKDWWVLAHVLGLAVTLTVLMFIHPDTAMMVAPSVCTLIGFAVHTVFRDDKIPDDPAA